MGRGRAPCNQGIAGVEYVTLAQQINPTQRSVANMSLGGLEFLPVETAVDASIAANVHYSVSAGNSNADACGFSPAGLLRATTVGATTITDNRAPFSNFGACVDFFAPGQNIVSAWFTADNAYATLSGTSMASPHAARHRGAVAAQIPGRQRGRRPQRPERECHPPGS